MKITHAAGISLFNRVRTIKAGLEQLETLAAIYDTSILPGKENSLDFSSSPKIIYYQSNQRSRKRLWAIAHELGHILALADYPDKLKNSFEHPSAGSFWELEDELQAWAFADIIIRQLSSNFYTKEYIQWKHQCLKTYYRYDPEEDS